MNSIPVFAANQPNEEKLKPKNKATSSIVYVYLILRVHFIAGISL
jgi:hypothetical protein